MMAETNDAQQDDLGSALTRLREQGERVTVARRAVLEILAATSEHLTADDLVAELSSVAPSVHRTTVYRTLDSLAGLGLVAHVHMPHGASTYHLLTESSTAHLHLACQGCGTVVDAPADLLDGVKRELARSPGFRLDPDHVALTGWCGSCVDGD